MASALLASRDESRDQPRWGERKVYMRKGPGKAGSKPGFNSQDPSRPRVQPPGRLREEPAMGMERFDEAASDDSSSLNRKSISVNHEARKDAMPPTTGGWSNLDAFVTFNVSSFSRQGIRELRRKLTQELEQVRIVYNKIETRELQLRGGFCQSGGGNVNASYSASQFSGNDVRNYGGKEVTSELASGGTLTPRQGQREARPSLQLNLAAVDTNMTAGDGGAAKEKRTPKANQYYRNEFVMGKEKMPPPDNKKGGNKRSAQSKTDVRETKRVLTDSATGKQLAEVMKQCGFMLTKLMKHKHGWVFNTPVDTVGLGLHDYHTIIKHPMDLGTVKSKLSANQYSTPLDFAEDIRLTFNNAMTYNPKGHDVHIMAEQLLQFFEERWKPVYEKYEEEKRKSWSGDDRAPMASQNMKKLPFNDPPKKNLKKTEPVLGPSPPPKSKPKNNTAVRTPAPKKPKAKDPHKREMSYEEKQKLSTSLQSLPPEKLENIVQIIKKRNPALCQHEDEIEVDIDSFDTETLWELDRFVNNCKKTMSKNKKKAMGGDQAQVQNDDNAVREKSPVNVVGDTPKKSKKGEQGEEDVDIDDDMPSTNFPPVEIEKDGGYASRSSSSSSSSSDSGSSSSDSDSGSSSGSDSDADEAHSPGAGSKASPRS
eukprot:Gb_40751 [translate_table: standard]